MPASQDILNSIENRLRELAQEIAALESARSELRADRPGKTDRPEKPRTTAARTRKRTPARPATRKGRPAAAVRATAASQPEQLSEEEWLERRAAELAAQSREAAAA